MNPNRHKRLRAVTMPEGAATDARYGYAVSDAPLSVRTPLRHEAPVLIVARVTNHDKAPWAVFNRSGAKIPGVTFDTLRNASGFGRDLLAYATGRTVARRGAVSNRARRMVARYASSHGGQGPATVAPPANALPRADAPPAIIPYAGA